MATKDIIGPGIGFLPGAVEFIVTRGLQAGRAILRGPHLLAAGQIFCAGVQNYATGEVFAAGVRNEDVGEIYRAGIRSGQLR